jgi:hypothetical protein
MSTSSDKQTPSLNGGSENQVIETNWDEFSAQVGDRDRSEFAVWLDDELMKLESRLERFVTHRPPTGGRR